MVRARKDAGLTQKELGAKVGATQNAISLIESGGQAASGFIMPICRVLKIPPPMHFESEDDATWSQIGHVLRNKNPKQFRRALALVQAMVEDEEERAAANDEEPKAANRK